jgi:hypothetical protein
MYANIQEHGYFDNPGARALLFVNPKNMKQISKARAGDAAASAFDFIPSAASPAYLTLNQKIVGDIAPATFENLKIEGSYGPT